MTATTLFSKVFKGYKYYTSPKNELFNVVSLEPNQQQAVFQQVAEARSSKALERKLIAFFQQYPDTSRVAIVDKSTVKSIKTIKIVENNTKHLDDYPSIELINFVELSAMDNYYSVASSANYQKILLEKRRKELRNQLNKQKVSADGIHLNIIPTSGKDYFERLIDYINKQDFELVIMSKSSFEDLKDFLGKEAKSTGRKISKAIFVV